MKPLNVFPIEDYLEKVRLAVKTGQKNLTLSQKEYTDLANSLAIVMTRLTGSLDKSVQEKPLDNIQINVDGGRF